MSDTTVADTDAVPSPDSDEAAASDEPTTDFAAQATEYKNRFAGSQRKLTETLTEKERLAKEVEDLRSWKAEKERADMTEVDRLKAETEDWRREAEQARSEAQRERLARKFPQAVEFYGDDPLPSEEKLAALNERLAAKGDDDESEPEPMIDPNNPRKPPPPPPADPLSAADRWLRNTLSGD